MRLDCANIRLRTIRLTCSLISSAVTFPASCRGADKVLSDCIMTLNRFYSLNRRIQKTCKNRFPEPFDRSQWEGSEDPSSHFPCAIGRYPNKAHEEPLHASGLGNCCRILFKDTIRVFEPSRNNKLGKCFREYFLKNPVLFRSKYVNPLRMNRLRAQAPVRTGLEIRPRRLRRLPHVWVVTVKVT